MRVDFEDARWNQDDSGFWLSLRLSSPSEGRQFLAEKKAGKKYTADLKEFKHKRSLDANAYCWVLLGKLSESLSTPRSPVTPRDVYRNLIVDVGGNYEILPVMTEHLDSWKSAWERNGIGWVCESLGKSKLEGYTNVICYYGSSTYDHRQMGRLIDLVVAECKQQGIETLPPCELERLGLEWK